MRAFTLAILQIVIISGASVSFGQDLSNYYTPYGFRFPYLDKGEYSLSFGTNYYSYNYEYDFPDSDNGRMSKSKNSAVIASGLYGISKSLLFRGSISLYPSLSSSENDGYSFDPFGGQVIYYKNKSEMHSYILPSATLVYRPNSRIELFADYSTSVSNTDQYRVIGTASTLESKVKREYHYIWAGVNIIGKL